MAKNLKVTQTKSVIGGNHNQRESMRSLGIKRIGQSVVREDTPANRGYINVVAHLVEVEEIDS